MTGSEFQQRQDARFADNEFQNITEGSFRDLAREMRQTFVAQDDAASGGPSEAQVQDIIAQFLLDSAQTGLAIMRDPQTGRLVITNTQPNLRELFLTCPASGSGNLQRYEFRLRYPAQEGAYSWAGDNNNIAQIEFQAQGQLFSGTIEQFRTQTFSLFYNSATNYSALITPVDVNLPCLLELVQR